MPTVTLSTGETITLNERFTHKMHRELFKAINKGVAWKQNLESGDFEKEIPAENIELQYEAVFSLLISRIELDGKEVTYSQEWLDDLLQADYQTLEGAVADIRNGPTVTDEAGKKKAAKGS